MPMCAMCERKVERWLPHPQRDQRSPLMVLLQTVGSDLDRYLCPHCQCNDREPFFLFSRRRSLEVRTPVKAAA